MGNNRRKIKLGVIGSGFIGRVHLNQFKSIENVELAGLTDLNSDMANKTAKEFKVQEVFESAQSMIDSPKIDALVIGVPNKHHAALAVRALQTGKHVLLEKPMAINGLEAKQIVEAQRATGNILMIAHQMRWQWLSLHAKQQVENGALGKIYNAKAGMWRKKAIPGWGSWFTRKSESGGGPLIDIGVHVLDLALWLLGNPRPVAVFGSTYAEFGPLKKAIGKWGTPQWGGYFDVEDLATAMIRMADGSTLTLEVSWAAHTDSDNRHFIHLMGSQGGLSLYSDRIKLTGQQFDTAFDIDVSPPTPGTATPGTAQATDCRGLLSRHFVDCINENRQPVSDAISGYVNNVILDAIYESAQTGKLVELDPATFEIPTAEGAANGAN